MPAEELRTFITGMLDRLEAEQREELTDALFTQAARGAAGWRPPAPDDDTVNEVKQFARAAVHAGSAEPDDVEARLRLGMRSFLAGDHAGARAILEWSDDNHPGHLLFATFAGILSEGTGARLSPTMAATLDVRADAAPTRGPELRMTSVAELVRAADCGAATAHHTAMLEAMRTAAERRTEAVLRNKRRSRYAHAAALVVSCLELSPATGGEEAFVAWVDDIRRRYARFPAFQHELRAACESAAIPPGWPPATT